MKLYEVCPILPDILANRLARQYGSDPLELTRAENSIMALHMAFVTILVFGGLCWLFLPKPISLAGLLVALFAQALTIVAIMTNLNGNRRGAMHIMVVTCNFAILGGVYVSGGFPHSLATQITVVLPLVAMRVYGARIGVMAALAYPVFGFCAWYLQSVLGWIPNLYPYQGMPVMAAFAFWFIGYFLAFILFYVQYREGRMVQNLLDAKQEKFAALAETDNLTQLFNGRKFQEYMETLISAATQTEQRFQLVYFDLNHFKRINDTYGHAAGDAVLNIIAQRLRQCVRDCDITARLGGDEFALILAEGLTTAETEKVLKRIEDKVSEPINYETHMLQVSASLGLACFPESAQTSLVFRVWCWTLGLSWQMTPKANSRRATPSRPVRHLLAFALRLP